MHAQRLIMAFDHTYLLKSMQQIQFGGRRGLVGGPWLPNNSSQAWIPLDEDEGQLFKTKTESRIDARNPCMGCQCSEEAVRFFLLHAHDSWDEIIVQ